MTRNVFGVLYKWSMIMKGKKSGWAMNNRWLGL